MAKLKDLGIGDEFPCYIIAEIGQNHQGDISLAKELIVLAKGCGANCVKFQKSSLHEKFTKTALDAPYECENSFGVSYGEHKAKLEFSHEEYRELKEFAEKDVQIDFTASAMDLASADFLLSLNVPFIKIGSGDTNNFILLEHVAKLGKPIVMSTGMQDLETVTEGVKVISKYHSDLALLHCVSAYPTPVEDVNLSIMTLYKKLYPGIVVGYSGHEFGINISIAAVALGAKVIERHFTKDKSLKGTDHKCSLDPSEFAKMVEGIRELEMSIGKPIKVLLPSEMPCHEKLGKSIVSTRCIPCGSILTLEDLCVKVSRPKGISPQNIYKLVGRKTIDVIESDEPILEEDLEA